MSSFTFFSSRKCWRRNFFWADRFDPLLALAVLMEKLSRHILLLHIYKVLDLRGSWTEDSNNETGITKLPEKRSVSLSLCFSVSLSLSFSVTRSLCHSVSLSLRFYIPLSIFPSVLLFLCLLSLCLSVSLSLCLSVCIPFQSPCLSASVSCMLCWLALRRGSLSPSSSTRGSSTQSS